MTWLLAILKIFLGIFQKVAEEDATSQDATQDPKLKEMDDELNNLPPTPPL